MHYALRPWPWIIVALASTLVFPKLADIAQAFPYVDPSLIGHDMAYPAMLRFLPAGFLGLVVAGHARRVSLDDRDAPQLGHVVPRARLLPPLHQDATRAERHYVLVGALTTALLMIAAASLTYALGTAKESVRPHPRHRRRHGAHLPAALVLVARERVERDRGDGQLVRRRGRLLRRAQDGASRCRATESLLITVAVDDGRLGRGRRSSRRRPIARRSSRSTRSCARPAPAGARSAPSRASRVARLPAAGAARLDARLRVRLLRALRHGEFPLSDDMPQLLMWLAVFAVSGIGLIRLFPRLWPAGAGGTAEG